MTAAGFVLAFHTAVVAFNVFGLVVIPVGAWRGWRFVRIYWWRLLHVLSMAAVALQALLGRACFLTLWQTALEGNVPAAGTAAPLIQRWVNAILFWPLPLWVFAAIYLLAFIYVAALWRLVPPIRSA
jgi:hypothetical protein